MEQVRNRHERTETRANLDTVFQQRLIDNPFVMLMKFTKALGVPQRIYKHPRTCLSACHCTAVGPVAACSQCVEVDPDSHCCGIRHGACRTWKGSTVSKCLGKRRHVQ
jgi:hypothetical protein